MGRNSIVYFLKYYLLKITYWSIQEQNEMLPEIWF